MYIYYVLHLLSFVVYLFFLNFTSNNKNPDSITDNPPLKGGWFKPIGSIIFFSPFPFSFPSPDAIKNIKSKMIKKINNLLVIPVLVLIEHNFIGWEGTLFTIFRGQITCSKLMWLYDKRGLKKLLKLILLSFLFVYPTTQKENKGKK